MMCNEPQLADYFPSWPLITNFLSVNAKYAHIVHIRIANVNRTGDRIWKTKQTENFGPCVYVH